MIRFAPILLLAIFTTSLTAAQSQRERISLNSNWRFTKGDPTNSASTLLYDVRPEVRNRRDDKAIADTEPTEAEKIAVTNRTVPEPWILPTANAFIRDPAKRHVFVSCHGCDQCAGQEWFGRRSRKNATSAPTNFTPRTLVQFVWSGWDYLGEPTPYYSSRSSYFGIIDLAGFKKYRFYLYQSCWRPELPSVHILPHWTWPEREGPVTPVHVSRLATKLSCF